MGRITLFADVILPLAVPNLYTYRIPFDWNSEVKIGQRVVVQFGKNKLYTALVRHIHEIPPTQYEAKYVEAVLDREPIVNIQQFELWDWLAGYYMCSIGEVMNAALPSGLRLTSETKIILNPGFTGDYTSLTDKEYLVVEALELRNVLTLEEVTEIIAQKTVHPIIKSLIEKKAVLIEETLKEKYKPKIDRYVRFTTYADQEENLKEIFNALEKKSAKQLQLLMHFIKLSERYSKNKIEVKKSALLTIANASTGLLDQLVKKNIVELYEKETGRWKGIHSENQLKALNEYQQQALLSVKEQFTEKEVVLLHGVTSSGKTEIYVQLIEEMLAKKKQVLYLLPEIALTTQIIHRLQKYFGNHVGIYHSRFNENERVEVWKKVQHKVFENTSESAAAFSVILGARSSVFLPFSDLGLIIVDEEHDSSYKQFDPAPRYNARDTAIYLAHIHGAKVLLGSATPSVESFYNAQNNKYGFAELSKRFGDIQMPEIMVTDVKEETRKKRMKSHFSPFLIEHIESTLANKEQVILFQNRRGFAPQLECRTCSWIPHCTQCDISLTYHKGIDQLRCHYCGYSVKPPITCNACGDANVKMKGFGTEKIEEELGVFFPNARVSRMDLDTTRAKYAYRQIINDFEDQKIDILVGTQMITKGLDFDNVALVGILSADSMLNFPDFRAFERSYQLMAQVSGRAGRKNKRGKVIIQTYHPYHSIIRDVMMNDYLSMYNAQLLDRRNFSYPPFYRLIELIVKHKEIEVLNDAAKYLAEGLRKHLGKRILGPEFPLVPRIRNQYLKSIMIKTEREASVSQVKKIISDLLISFKNNTNYKSVKVQVDVDPM